MCEYYNAVFLSGGGDPHDEAVVVLVVVTVVDPARRFLVDMKSVRRKKTVKYL